MESLDSIFRPRCEPARTIYDALVKEQMNRGINENWILDERGVVWSTARDWAQQHGLRVPTMYEVMKAERLADGHVDYTSKFAYGVAEVIIQSIGESTR